MPKVRVELTVENVEDEDLEFVLVECRAVVLKLF